MSSASRSASRATSARIPSCWYSGKGCGQSSTPSGASQLSSGGWSTSASRRSSDASWAFAASRAGQGYGQGLGGVPGDASASVGAPGQASRSSRTEPGGSSAGRSSRSRAGSSPSASGRSFHHRSIVVASPAPGAVDLSEPRGGAVEWLRQEPTLRQPLQQPARRGLRARAPPRPEQPRAAGGVFRVLALPRRGARSGQARDGDGEGEVPREKLRPGLARRAQQERRRARADLEERAGEPPRGIGRPVGVAPEARPREADASVCELRAARCAR
jgi:hypothetical protein